MNRALKSLPAQAQAESQPLYIRQAIEDWNWKEEISAAMEAAAEREDLLEAAFVLAPRFKLFPLERNWWIARISEPPDQYFDHAFPDGEIEGVKESRLLDPQTLIVRSDLPANTLLENIELLFLPF